MKRLKIETKSRCELVDITGDVERIVCEHGIKEGIAVIYSPHTTGGIIINENADPSVVKDITIKLGKLVEKEDPAYRHFEGNSDSHIKSSVVGASQVVLIEGGRPLLGRWQGIFFAEFDGPRSRNVFVKIISD